MVSPANTLTTREAQVLRYAARGLGNKQIARELGISDWTVKEHLGNVYAKFGLLGAGRGQARTRAVVAAMKVGALALEGEDG